MNRINEKTLRADAIATSAEGWFVYGAGDGATGVDMRRVEFVPWGTLADNDNLGMDQASASLITQICEAASYLTPDRLAQMPAERLEEIAEFLDDAAWDAQFASTTPATFERWRLQIEQEKAAGTIEPMFDEAGKFIQP